MIWFRGEIADDDALKLSVLDRTAEHGLGLFETLRTWNGHATLLARHRERMHALGPRAGVGVRECRVSGRSGRCEARSGSSRSTPSRAQTRSSSSNHAYRRSNIRSPCGAQLWMTAAPLPEPLPASGAVITRSIQVASDDVLARHKTLNYWRKRLAYERALADGCDEVLCVTPSGLVCEGTRSNLFVVVGRRLWTPALDGPLLPGIMRQVVLEHAARLGIETVEAPLPLAQLAGAEEAFLTNSARGVAPIAVLMDRPLAPSGPVTGRLWGAILPWLESGGTTP